MPDAVDTAIDAENRRQYRVDPVGRIEDIRFQCHAITVERRLKHPAVVAISKTARKTLFPPVFPLETTTKINTQTRTAVTNRGRVP